MIAVFLLPTLLLAVLRLLILFLSVERPMSDPLSLPNNDPGNATDSHSVP